MRSWLTTRARLDPDGLALTRGGHRCSWRQLHAGALRRARGLARAGVGPGDVVATLVWNDADAVELLHAIWMRGATVLPLNLRWTTTELARVLVAGAPRLVLYGDDELAPLALHAAGGLGVPVLENESAPELGDEPDDDADGPQDAAVEVPFDSARVAALIGTSGTTGSPKLVALEGRAMAASALGSALRLGVAESDCWFVALPGFHVGGLAIHVRAVLFGTAVALPGSLDAGFQPQAFVGELVSSRATVVSMVPTMLRRIVDTGLDAPPALRCVLVGGGPIPGPLVERAWRAGWPVATTYGLTEAGSQVATSAPAGARAPRGSGSALDLTCVALDDGEILVRGPTVMRGYHLDPEATRAALSGGWLRTGDRGEIDDAGALHVLDRRDDLIVSGGENVSPAEVEGVLAEHPGVLEVAVAAEPDDDLGRRVAAWVVPSREPAPTLDELREFARARLAGYKLPRALHRVERLPRTATGKIRRDALTALDP